VRVRARAVVRWSATGADGVTSWRVSLDGKVVAKVAGGRKSATRRITRAGSHTFRVVGFDEAGAKVVAGRRTFKARRAR